MKRLFEVEMIVRAVVAADSDTHAWQVAVRDRREIVGDSDADFDVVTEIKRETDLPEGWDAECIPFGDGNERIAEYLDNPPPVRDTKTIDMFSEGA